jgi:coenzyme Q-binding protein COQ10
MPRLDKNHVVNHSARDMFNLVCDVECYPQFVPLCQSLTVKSHKEKAGKTLMMADMTMAYKMLSETFTTQVLMNSETLEIDVKYIDGPFKHLDNQWKFKDLEMGKCEVSFMIDYELRSKMLAMAAGAVFDMAFGRFVDAFEKRADEVYA